MNGSCVSSRQVELRLPGRLLDKPLVSVSSNKADGCADGGVGVWSREFG